MCGSTVVHKLLLCTRVLKEIAQVIDYVLGVRCTTRTQGHSIGDMRHDVPYLYAVEDESQSARPSMGKSLGSVPNNLRLMFGTARSTT